MVWFRISLWLLCLTFTAAQLNERAGNRTKASAPNTGSNWTIESFKDGLNATTFALIYGYPLVPVAKFLNLLLTQLGENFVFSVAALSNADSRSVVRPNVDTLYTVAGIDLSQADLAITLPNITDGRYCVLPFYDIYGNNFANIGSVTNSTPGKYLLRRAEDSLESPGLRLTNLTDDFKGIVNFPTTYGFIIGRILLRNNKTDLDIVHSYQSQITLKLVNRTIVPNPKPPRLSMDLLNGGLTGTISERILQVTARVAPYAKPEDLDRIDDVEAILATAGIKDGKYTPRSDVILAEAEQLQSWSIENEMTIPEYQEDLGNGWAQLNAKLGGNFKENYATRAYVAAVGLGQLTADQALYPFYTGEGPSRLLYLEPNQAKLFTFSSRPPLSPGGFWSLTAYGADQFLIPNAQNVFALGDRSNLTFADGTPVYGDNTEKDGTFQILIQPADLPPPNNWTSNWLPGPPGGGIFSANLRWYSPLPEMTNGSYKYPLVTNITAITASNTSTIPVPSATSSTAPPATATNPGSSNSAIPNSAVDNLSWNRKYWMFTSALCLLYFTS